MWALILGVLLSTAPPSLVLACDCSAMAPARALAEADVAFVGVAWGLVQPQAEGATFAFSVEQVLKGEIDPEARISTDPTDCAMTFAARERWRVYAYADGGRLVTHLCAGNEQLAENVEPVAPREPSGGSLPDGVLIGAGSLLLVAVVSVLAFTRMRPGSSR
jgi:hypothetical protein